MAYLDPNDKLKDQQSDQQGMPVGGAVAGQSGVAGSAGGGAFVPQAGVGAGGTGAWTNIQSYINANQNSGDKIGKELSNTVGNQFDTEKQKANQSADQFKQQAQKSVDESKVNQDKASQIINDASKNYSYSGQQNDQYKQAINPLQNYFQSSYSGPKQFSYGMGNETQKVGSDLQNDQGFNQYLRGIYGKVAGHDLSSGQNALQNQLDVNNNSIQNARQDALKQYAGLQGDINNTVQNTNALVPDFQKQYGANQDEFKKYLLGQADTAKQNFQNAWGQARNDFAAPEQAAVSEAERFQRLSRGTVNDSDINQLRQLMSASPSLRGRNPDQVIAGMSDPQKAQALWRYQYAGKGGNDTELRTDWADNMKRTADETMAAKRNQFSQNVDDADKRRFNSIMDLLGQNDRLAETQGYQ